MIRQGVRTNVTWTLVTVFAILGVEATSVVTGRSHDWSRVENVLLVSIGAGLLATGVELAMVSRAGRSARTSVKQGSRCRKPVWMILGEYTPVLLFGGVLAAGAALVGLPVIGLILFLAFAAFFAFAFGTEVAAAETLTFESVGLRIQNRQVGFLIPWRSIARVEQVGSGLYQTVHVHTTERTSVVESTQPNTLAARAFVAALVSTREDAGLLKLSPWIGGLDAQALSSAMRQEIKSSC